MENDRLIPVLMVHVKGKFEFLQSPMPFTETTLANRQYGAGRGNLFGRNGVWVRTVDQATKRLSSNGKVDENKSDPLFAALPDVQFT